MTKDEVVNCAKQALDMEYGSVVMQSGERSDPEYVDFVEECLKEIKNISNGKLGITLSLGEQERDTYRRWYDAGAHRYLLRIESSSEKLYKTLHPEDHSFAERKKCLDYLRDEGYQVGTGVLTGIPGQSYQDLVNDIMFFKEQDIDMIGMGPYIMHPATPMASSIANQNAADQLLKALKMIACVRLAMPDINIAATTALQALDPQGREKGLKAGANVIMPNLTDTKYRESYKLYDGKPCLDENATQCRGCLEGRITGIGESISYNEWGDSPHFEKKQNQEVC
ncbi:MAG: [FeFe] hydrogenase H-cluster radical SAM maturase HydE, partial [Planctomycetota bacterium]|jgi:biotin synthase